MPKVVLPSVEVMQYEARPYKGKDGGDRFFRSMVVRIGGKLFSFSTAKDLSDADANALVGKTVNLEFEVSTFGSSLDATFRVVGAQKGAK